MKPETVEREKARRRAYYLANKEKVIARATQWNRDNKEKSRASVKRWQESNKPARNQAAKRHWLKSQYGITLQQKQEMILAQNKLCAICETSDPGKRGWHVDHCHESTQVRGVLCNHCNLMLGHARDSEKILAKAIEYLGKSRATAAIRK